MLKMPINYFIFQALTDFSVVINPDKKYYVVNAFSGVEFFPFFCSFLRLSFINPVYFEKTNQEKISIYLFNDVHVYIWSVLLFSSEENKEMEAVKKIVLLLLVHMAFFLEIKVKIKN